jgi:hypothetical protein
MNSSTGYQGAQVIDPQPVPEPGTLAIWGLGFLAVAVRVCTRKRRAAAG